MPVGNPPWGPLSTNEAIWLGAWLRGDAEAPNAAARNRLVKALVSSDNPADRALAEAWEDELQIVDKVSAARVRGRTQVYGWKPLIKLELCNSLELCDNRIVSIEARRGSSCPLWLGAQRQSQPDSVSSARAG